MTFRRARSLLLVSAISCVGALACAGAAGAATGGVKFVPGEVVVRAEGERDFFVLELPAGVGVPEAARSLSRNPEVVYAEPNFVARIAEDWIPSDPGKRGGCPGPTNCDGTWQDRQWNFLDLDTEPGGVQAPGAWGNLGAPDPRPGFGVTVAVIDTGVAYANRPPHYKRSPDFDADQFTPAKYDWVGKDPRPLDRNGHGTHVAGTIAERTDNDVAVTGLADGAQIMPLRALDAGGDGKTSDVAKAIKFAANNGAHVINLSLEFGSSVQPQAVADAIDYAHDVKGVVIVAAAGNNSASRVRYPARGRHVIAVSATTRAGCLAEYSDHGGKPMEGVNVDPDIAAPGGGSNAEIGCAAPTNPGTDVFQMTFSWQNGDYTRFSIRGKHGTSMSAAHVSGVAALVIASGVLGGLPTPEQVEYQLEQTARTIGDGDPELYGAGLLDADAATAAAAP